MEGIETNLHDEAETRVVCRSAAAMLGLVADRLRLAYLAVIGDRDPGLLWSRHTAAPERVPGLPPAKDLVLEADPAPSLPQRRR